MTSKTVMSALALCLLPLSTGCVLQIKGAGTWGDPGSSSGSSSGSYTTHGLDEDEDNSIEVSCTHSGKRLEIEIIDGGKPFNPFENISVDIASSIEDREIGGLGRFLVRELMDEVDYERRLDKNVVKLIMNISGQGTSD